MRYNTGVSETWFDKRSGKLFIGREAAGPYLDYREDYEPDFEDDSLPQLVPLVDLIEARQLDFPTDTYGENAHIVWSREQMLEVGRWVMTLIEVDGQPQPLRERHMRRLRSLGYGAAMSAIRTEFDGFIPFKEELGSPFRSSHGRFDHWTLTNYIKLAAELAARLGRKPESPDYVAAFEADECPSSQTIDKHTGGFGKLHEYIGYPDIRGSDNDQLVSWGVRALRANIATGIPPELIDGLSRLKRGPSVRTIVNRFDAVSAFQVKVEQELIRQNAEHAQQRADKLDRYSWYVADDLLDIHCLDEDERLLIAGGLRRLVDHFLPDIDENTKRDLAQLPPDDFIKSLLYEYSFNKRDLRRPTIQAGHVEEYAIRLGIYEDIWPLDTDLAQLHFDSPRKPLQTYTMGNYQRKQQAKQAA
jgi:hypothetical protein